MSTPTKKPFKAKSGQYTVSRATMNAFNYLVCQIATVIL